MSDRDCRSDNQNPAKPRRRFSLFGLVFKILFVWALLVFTGGTLQHVNHPVAYETGRLIQTVTFVEPSIYWADSHGYRPLSSGLRFLANGADVNKITMAVSSAKACL